MSDRGLTSGVGETDHRTLAFPRLNTIETVVVRLDCGRSLQGFWVMKLHQLLVLVLFSCVLPQVFAQTCPMPDDVLGRSLENAKRAMSKAIGENWSPIDLGCPDGPISLHADWESGSCKIPGGRLSAQIMISGFEGSGTVVGLFYLLSSKMAESDIKRLFAPGVLKQVTDYPMPLRTVVPVPSEDVLFVSEKDGRVLRIGPEHGNPDRQIVQLFDLHVVDKEIVPMRTCARLTRTLRRDDAQRGTNSSPSSPGSP
ncbi:hypothetical protein [Burkholderia cenocepacia]|uniref:hypothetical protein n=1 Tax=Burkholderia cenocepacia TaxID=95486 RepID=UPI002AB786D6|nr:hypothetical protein [Burkholderia cenocepacia]